MDELSEEARRLIARAMDEDLPPPGAEDGSWGTVVARLTGERSIASDDAPEAAPLHEPVEGGTRPRNWWPAIGVAIAIIVASSIAIALRPSTSTTPAAPRPAIDATPPPAPATLPRPSTTATGTAPAHAADDDGLLERAESALAADQGADALALLERHAVVAALVEPERRMALRVLALCELGRVDDARVEARTFLAAHAASEHASRVRASCARP